MSDARQSTRRPARAGRRLGVVRLLAAGGTALLLGGVLAAPAAAQPPPPEITSPQDGACVNSNDVNVAGTAQALSEVKVYDSAEQVIGTTSANLVGSWTTTVTFPEDGFYIITATAEDLTGESDPSDTASFTVDTVAPNPPAITQPASGSTVFEVPVGFSGVAEPLSTVTLYEDGDPARVGEADADGAWTLEADLGLGERTVAATAADCAGNESDESGPVTILVKSLERFAGANRIETAVEISGGSFGDGEASAVVVARADDFPDAISGTPFAVAEGGPLLLSSRSALSEETAEEIQRVLPEGGTVYLLGGEAALSEQVEADVDELGYEPERVAGPNRYSTAVEIARRTLGDPTGADQVVLLASGLDFPDALAAGPAAANAANVTEIPESRGAIVLTRGGEVPAETAVFLEEYEDARLYAVGGPSAAAEPSAQPLAGPNRYATAVEVAQEFFGEAAMVGIATGENFPDALAGGAHIGTAGAPLLLTRTASLHPATGDELAARAATIAEVFLYGGAAAVSEQAEGEIKTALS